MKIENKVKQTLKKLKLSKKEKIVVALSGGKDSATTAYFLHKFGYKIEGLHIDLGMGDYSKRCRDAVEKLCGLFGIKLYVYDVKKEMGSSMCYIRTSIQARQTHGEIKNCAICGVIKKWILNKVAREKGFKLIATGHNLDDEAQTFLINILKGSPELSANTGCITQNTKDRKFVARIKPLFYVFEDDVRKFTKEKKLPVIYEGCPCLIDSYRKSIREWMRKNLNEKQKENIMKNFERLILKLQKLKSGESVNYCGVCGEPARGKVCRKCKLFG